MTKRRGRRSTFADDQADYMRWLNDTRTNTKRGVAVAKHMLPDSGIVIDGLGFVPWAGDQHCYLIDCKIGGDDE